ncbi:hypothetical protein EMQ25_13745 [Arsenicitalea aurantiaca]|uniref:Uncharacterized protein n=1 Tax=Arsenicitalea aurantiaca TaxID=1783274 RepID=A0A433X8G9_9HYPH|nr:hypothetical protein [Arsenicitalea aurantiaca]RUT30365.1 hypothetical protein EMQ25_13745 [Arsenicitalea aurantiaca]
MPRRTALSFSRRPDPSGWVRIAVLVAGAEVFVGFMDHPYEEYELWPTNAPLPEKGAEAPGRMSKHLWWLNLSATAWPVLADLAEEGWFSAEVPDR